MRQPIAGSVPLFFKTAPEKLLGIHGPQQRRVSFHLSSARFSTRAAYDLLPAPTCGRARKRPPHPKETTSSAVAMRKTESIEAARLFLVNPLQDLDHAGIRSSLTNASAKISMVRRGAPTSIPGGRRRHWMN